MFMSKARKPSFLATMVMLCVLTFSAPAAHASTVDISPPGANDWSCQPSEDHPYPVVLVPGTFESMAKNWSTLSPRLKNQGYCVFALNYGETNGLDATGPVAESAKELAPFVDAVLAATGAKKVDLVGHSQGGHATLFSAAASTRRHDVRLRGARGPRRTRPLQPRHPRSDRAAAGFHARDRGHQQPHLPGLRRPTSWIFFHGRAQFDR